MDVFTDVDIFKEVITSTLRGVAVYILLDESHFNSFLSMTRRVGVNIHDLKVRTMQTERKQSLDNLTNIKFSTPALSLLLREQVSERFYDS